MLQRNVLVRAAVVLNKQGAGEVLKHGQRDRQAHPPGGQLERVVHVRPQGHDGRNAGQLGDNLDAAGVIEPHRVPAVGARAGRILAKEGKAAKFHGE